MVYFQILIINYCKLYCSHNQLHQEYASHSHSLIFKSDIFIAERLVIRWLLYCFSLYQLINKRWSVCMAYLSQRVAKNTQVNVLPSNIDQNTTNKNSLPMKLFVLNYFPTTKLKQWSLLLITSISKFYNLIEQCSLCINKMVLTISN